MEEVIEMESWNPEKPYFAKKDILEKKHQTEVIRGYAIKEGKRVFYRLETYDNVFGDRQVQITSTQASRVKDKSVPFKVWFTSTPVVIDGKDCYSLKMSFDKIEWF